MFMRMGLTAAAVFAAIGPASAFEGSGAEPVSRISVSSIAAAAGSPLPLAGSARVEIAGRVFDLAPEAAIMLPGGNGISVRGAVVGAEGHFVLSEAGGFVTGAVWTPEAAYEFRPIDDRGGVRLIEIDPASLPACATEGVFGGPVPGAAPRGGPEEVVRVFVAFTNTAEALVGGPAATLSFAASAVQSANTAYANSLMTVGDDGVVACRLELAGVYTFEVPTGLGASGLLSAVRSTSDGLMDEVHLLRDASGADMVALISENGIGACGIAYLAPTDPTRMFSVTAEDCALGNLTFAHELGHNFGASHDADNAGSGYTPYGFGWRWNTTGGSLRRSVMAYSPGTRRPFFSNPEVFDGGGATGNAQQADNARLIGETFPILASHRLGTGDGTNDCDQNGVIDLLEITLDPALDSDASGVLDSCELDQGLLEDCNGDGVADIGQVSPRQLLTPPPVSLGGFPPLEADLGAVLEASSAVEIAVVADADLSGAAEYIDIRANGVLLARLFDTGGADCDAAVTTATLTLSAQEWNDLGPEVVLGVTRSSAVDPYGCAGNTVTFRVDYAGLNREFDANGDGILDECAPGCSPADIAEPFGVLDLADISAFIAAFAGADPSADLDGNGVFDLGDISAFITGFNAGCP
jgi:hypothetical protein